jgi:hypothetical protein
MNTIPAFLRVRVELARSNFLLSRSSSVEVYSQVILFGRLESLIIQPEFQTFPFHVVKATVYIGTLPYYRLYQFNTVNPILQIAASTSQPGRSQNVLRLVVRWRTRKLAELHFISIAVGHLSPTLS